MHAAGSWVSVFASTLHVGILRGLAAGPLSPGDLERVFSWAPESSLRRALSKLAEAGVVARPPGERAKGGALDLTDAGHDLLPVAAGFERWLATGPGGPVPLESPEAQGAIRALIAGWESDMIQVLAEQPRRLIELSDEIDGLNYPALKRRLSKLRSAGLVLPAHTDAGPVYEVSEWMRRAVLPLAAATRWERRHGDGGEKDFYADLEAILLLALPLTRPAARVAGPCALAVLASRTRKGAKPVGGAVLDIEGGKVVSCAPGTPTDPPTWAMGTVDAWLTALLEGRSDELRFGGAKPGLARGIVRVLHDNLFLLVSRGRS